MRHNCFTKFRVLGMLTVMKNSNLRVIDRPAIYLRLKPELFEEVGRLAGEKKIKSLNKFLNLFLEQKLQKKTACKKNR